MKNIKTLLLVFVVALLFCGCDKAKQASEVNSMTEQSTDDIQANGDEDIPSLGDIIEKGTSEYNDRKLQEKGYNELVEYYNALAVEFNAVNEKYAMDTVPQSDEIEKKVAEVNKQIENIEQAIDKATKYGEAISLVNTIKDQESAIAEISDGIDKLSK